MGALNTHQSSRPPSCPPLAAGRGERSAHGLGRTCGQWAFAVKTDRVGSKHEVSTMLSLHSVPDLIVGRKDLHDHGIMPIFLFEL